MIFVEQGEKDLGEKIVWGRVSSTPGHEFDSGRTMTHGLKIRWR